MATEEKNPLTRPGFLVAAGIVTLIALLGIGLSIKASLTNSPAGSSEAPPAVSSSAPSEAASTPAEKPTTQPADAAESDSVCGLPGLVAKGRITSPPEAEWEYGSIMAYPTSSEYGPADTTSDGVRMCFQHSPHGALFAAANMMEQMNSQKLVPWIKYAVAEGEARDELLDHEIASPRPTTDDISVRSSIEGFKLLSYSAAKARVDVVMKVVGSGRTMYLSAIYTLVWEKGDWKLYTENPRKPVDVTQINSVSGYITWGE